MQVHVGCSGWFYSHWRGVFYPKQEVSTKLWFAYYANVFRTVELNAPFYRWPKPATVKRWQREAPPGFRYSVKAHRSITHERKLVGTKKLVASFYEIGDRLKARGQLGCFLFQFPPSFHFRASRLKAIVAQLSARHPTAVEFRHKSWWTPQVYRTLQRHGLIFCAVSAPRLPEAVPAGGEVIYARLHGTSQWYRHDYSDEELAAWAQKIVSSGAKEAWVYFDNDRNGYAVKNALRFRRMLRARLEPDFVRTDLNRSSPSLQRAEPIPSRP